VGIPVDDVRTHDPGLAPADHRRQGLPVGEEDVAGTEFDFTVGRRSAPRGSTPASRVSLEGRTAGRAHARVGRRRSGVEVWADDGFGYLQVYTGDTLEPASRRRQAVAIEPMTCPPNAFASGVDVIRLEPGASWSGAWGIALRRG
jgi:aldose 1-epimerase